MRNGLVVGKFMPFHRGHQLLVETALAQTDRLTVVVYDTIVDIWAESLMPAQKRARWIAELYPGVHNILVVPDRLEGPHDSHDGPEFSQIYADQLAFLGQFTHVFSSEKYGEPFAKALGAEHVMVDAARELVPISGTEFRKDMYKNRAYVHPLVYRDLIRKVVFVGTESTGKSTLTEALAKRFNTLYTKEYGRTLWVHNASMGIGSGYHDFYDIAVTQNEQEQNALLHSNRVLFCDTNAWTTMLWAEMYYGIGEADARIYELAERTKHEYEWFMLDNNFDWVDDGSRELDGDKSHEFQRIIENRLKLDGIRYNYVTGSLEDRIKYVSTVLELVKGLRDNNPSTSAERLNYPY